jgi:TRAP-type C4-dicarboxylate transport system permease small subunit
MKKISKHLISLAILALLVIPAVTFAQSTNNNLFGTNEVNTGLAGSLADSTTSDPRAIIGKIINIALGFLGVIAVGIILLGGFKWMTAAGNEDKTTEAKQLLGAGVIGLIIILSAWALATFIIQQIYGATGA